MNKCEDCGYLHYRTDPCRSATKSTAARKDVRVKNSDVLVHTASQPMRLSEPAGTQAPPVDTIQKPKRSGNRHRPGYFTEYMREYRAGKRRRSPPKPSIQTTTEERNDK